MEYLKNDNILGKCFKRKHTHYLVKITRKFISIDGVLTYRVQKLRKSLVNCANLTASQLLDLYEFDPVATVLHGSTVEELQRERQIEKSIKLGTMYGTTTGRWIVEYFSS